MKLSKYVLFFACAAFSAHLGASEAAKQEPIPDFGPEGPVGYNPPKSEPQPSANASRLAQAQGAGRSFGLVRAALRQLDLNPRQQQAIKVLFEDYAEKGQKLRSEMTRIQDTIKVAQTADNNQSAVKSARKAMADLSKKGKSLQGDMRESLSKILSEEQLTKFNQIQEARRKQIARRART